MKQDPGQEPNHPSGVFAIPEGGEQAMAWTNRTKHVTTTTRKHILNRDKHTCQHCGTTTGPLEVDHINNSRGPGYNDDHNLQALCATCHAAKTHTEQKVGLQRRAARRHLPTTPHPGLS